MRTEIRIAGFGGQGIILAGLLLGKAAIKDGKYAVQTQSYGPESRGGAARSEVVISDQVIDYPKVVEADILIALSQTAYDKFSNDSEVSLNFILQGSASAGKEIEQAKANKLISIAETRKDCVAFISPY